MFVKFLKAWWKLQVYLFIFAIVGAVVYAAYYRFTNWT